MPVHLLNELVRQLPDGVYLTSMKQDNQTVTLQGMAQSNERVSELAAQPGQQQPLAGQAGAGRNHLGHRQPEPARPASRRELHDAHRPASGPPMRRRPPPPAAQALRACSPRGRRSSWQAIAHPQRSISPTAHAAIGRSSSMGSIRTTILRSGRRSSAHTPCSPSQSPAWFWRPCGSSWLTNSNDELEAERAKEVTLRRETTRRRSRRPPTSSLLKKQREQVQQYVTLLEKQLPSKAEMDALLSDINQAGLGRSLQFELFRPGQVVGQGLLRRTAHRRARDGSLPRHGRLCRGRREPFAHRDLEQSVRHAAEGRRSWSWTRRPGPIRYLDEDRASHAESASSRWGEEEMRPHTVVSGLPRGRGRAERLRRLRAGRIFSAGWPTQRAQIQARRCQPDHRAEEVHASGLHARRRLSSLSTSQKLTQALRRDIDASRASYAA